MGLFDFLKPKSKPQSTSVSFKKEYMIPNYDPWDKSPLPRNDNYATAYFISISQSGAPIRKCKEIDFHRRYRENY